MKLQIAPSLQPPSPAKTTNALDFLSPFRSGFTSPAFRFPLFVQIFTNLTLQALLFISLKNLADFKSFLLLNLLHFKTNQPSKKDIVHLLHV